MKLVQRKRWLAAEKFLPPLWRTSQGERERGRNDPQKSWWDLFKTNLLWAQLFLHGQEVLSTSNMLDICKTFTIVTNKYVLKIWARLLPECYWECSILQCASMWHELILERAHCSSVKVLITSEKWDMFAAPSQCETWIHSSEEQWPTLEWTWIVKGQINAALIFTVNPSPDNDWSY